MADDKEYIVTMPIYGSVEIIVKASSKAHALEAARAGDWLHTEPPSWGVSEKCRGMTCHRTESDDIKVELNA